MEKLVKTPPAGVGPGKFLPEPGLPHATVAYLLLFFLRVKLLIFVGVNVFGWLGWQAGEQFGLLGALVLSAVGSAFGVYAGWWTARRLLE